MLNWAEYAVIKYDKNSFVLNYIVSDFNTKHANIKLQQNIEINKNITLRRVCFVSLILSNIIKLLKRTELF